MLIRLAEQDNVAVATKNLAKGTKVEVEGVALTTRDAIPFAHKVAIRAIELGGQVFKYGAPRWRSSPAATFTSTTSAATTSTTRSIFSRRREPRTHRRAAERE